MAQIIDKPLLNKLSILARVPVASADEDQRLVDMNNILVCISELDAIDIPADFQFHYNTVNALRADVAYSASDETNAIILDDFPRRVDYRVSVPQVLKK